MSSSSLNGTQTARQESTLCTAQGENNIEGSNASLPATITAANPNGIHSHPTQPAPPTLVVTTEDNPASSSIPNTPVVALLPSVTPAPIVRPSTPVSATSSIRGGSVVIPSTPLHPDNPHIVWGGLKALVIALDKYGDGFGPLKPALDIFSDCVTKLEEFGELTQEYQTLRRNLDWLFHDLAGSFGKEIPPGMRPSIVNLATGLEREINFVGQKANQTATANFLYSGREIEDVVECYKRIQICLERMTLNANVNVWMIVDEMATVNRLDKLNPAHPAESKNLYRDECTPDTRAEALERFRVWRDDEDGEKIYWLNGMAGTGKTTLSYTLCKTLEGSSRLAANFFCSRQLTDCRDVNRIIPTIAYQLAKFSYPFRYALSRALHKDSDLAKRRISEQYKKLMFEPLREVTTSLPRDLVIVIEALDEIEDANTMGELLEVLFEYAPQLPIRFFLTSRPEPIIRVRMLDRTGDREKFELHLHELDKAIVGDDIKKFLRVGLKRAKVTEDQLEDLAERSGVLFIYAATVVRYVGDFQFTRSARRLAAVLGATTVSANGIQKDINALYALILTAAFDEDLEKHETEEMRLVLHTVICSEEPLTIPIIGGLLGLDHEGAVPAALSPLRSVLNIEKTSEGITTLHKSFQDYLLDPERSQRFYCDSEKHHAYLVQRCFQLINEPDPPFNICKLELSGRPDADVPLISEKVQKNISGHLIYACRYWSTHLAHIKQPPTELYDQTHAMLSTRLLLWIEVMNLTGRLDPEGIRLLNELKEKVEVGVIKSAQVAELT
ncbi:WD repeat-containing protein [Ceratobasidium sp. AG-Ba]|nr:WD repeat-containing protein [Ceratobasidium sp. AG-Ba]